MFVMLVFHIMSGAFGAGPVEDRVKEASPWNCGHSYWSKSPWLDRFGVFASVVGALTELPSRVKIAVKLDEMKSRVKIANAKLWLRIFILMPQRVNE